MKFSERHIGVNENDKNFMLSYLGVDSIEELISEMINFDKKEAKKEAILKKEGYDINIYNGS